MKKKINVLCTLGPSSLNPKFLKYTEGKVSLVRLNMSHIKINSLEKKIKYIRKYCKTPICLDTEGAQIRTKVNQNKTYKFKIGSKIILNKVGGKFNLYPQNIFNKLKINDILDIGFEGLKAKIIKINKKIVLMRCLRKGNLETNKGVHVVNRKVSIDYLTEKDFKAIQIAKKLKIKNFALSFTNSESDILKFKKILPNSKKIFKLETSNALKNLNKLFRLEKNFLVDRGDLSKDISIENIPMAQRYIFASSKKFSGINIAIATNFLESMIDNPYPTRAEVNDIFNSLEMGAKGLVLAAETAIGKHPIECVTLLLKIIKAFKLKNRIKFN